MGNHFLSIQPRLRLRSAKKRKTTEKDGEEDRHQKKKKRWNRQKLVEWKSAGGKTFYDGLNRVLRGIRL